MYHFLFLLLIPFVASATHNRAGEITFRQTDDLTIFITVTTYTKASSIQADRDSVLVFWGDGTSSNISRTNGGGTDVGNNTKFNIYQASHTYPGRSRYTISVEDPNRVSNILNINTSNSESIKFYIETTFTFTNSTFDGPNNSVRLLQAPIDIACVGRRFVHLPNAYDIDKDSIAFELITPLAADGIEVPNYVLPDQILPGADNTFSFNTETGAIIWDAPKKQGEYNVAFKVNEYRNGVLINSMIRDMQIFVNSCSNSPPTIQTIDEICVIAGETVQFEIRVDDPNENQRVKLEATGAPFNDIPNLATLDIGNDYMDPPFTAIFTWNTRCEDISKTPYQVVFRALDDAFGQNIGLADLKSVKIQVVGPPPENLIATPNPNSIDLFWDMPYSCEVTVDEYFRGFSVWRKQSNVPYVQDTCQPGLSQTSYERISFPETTIDNGLYTYRDSDIEKGITYCYRTEAEFAKITDAGFPYNFVEGLASNEICIQAKRDIPILTQVSVEVTDVTNGEIDLQWLKPDIPDLDTILYPGPYIYEVERSNGIATADWQAVNGANFTTQNFLEKIDTSFTDTGLNTEIQGYTYRIAFYTSGIEEAYDYSPPSSSIFLNSTGLDNEVLLNWQESTSWYNELYRIFQQDPIELTYDLRDSTADQSILIERLINGTEYCFYNEGQGTYIIEDLPYPLLNKSNVICDSPIDTIPPCAPAITVTNPCDNASDNTPADDFENTIEWVNVQRLCEDSEDTKGYNIYFKQNEGSDFEFLDYNDGPNNTRYIHVPEEGLLACYAVTAVDSMDNESLISQTVCINDCPSYILPNAFTPNGDGANDVFVPILNRFVSSIQIKIFTERGVLVYETEDPEINWEGKSDNGNFLSDGVYYYNCQVFRDNIDGGIELYQQLSGFIELIKS